MRGETTVLLIMIASSCALKLVEDDLLLFWRRTNVAPCEPFTTFKLECNRCVCSADAILYCTKMYCAQTGVKHNKVSEEEM